MVTKIDTATLALSKEELIVLLQLLRAPGLIGMEEQLSNSKELSETVLLAAERSLRARNILQFEKDLNKVNIDPITLGFIGTCLLPQSTLIFSYITQERLQRIRYYHVSQYLAVENFSPEPGIFSFRGANSIEYFIPEIEALMGLDTQLSPNCSDGFILEKNLLEARDLAKSRPPNEILNVLEKGGLKKSTSKKFLKQLIEANQNGSIIRTDYLDDEKTNFEGFSFLGDNKSFWLMKNIVEENAELVQLIPTSAAEMRNQISLLLS